MMAYARQERLQRARLICICQSIGSLNVQRVQSMLFVIENKTWRFIQIQLRHILCTNYERSISIIFLSDDLVSF